MTTGYAGYLINMAGKQESEEYNGYTIVSAEYDTPFPTGNFFAQSQDKDGRIVHTSKTCIGESARAEAVAEIKAKIDYDRDYPFVIVCEVPNLKPGQSRFQHEIFARKEIEIMALLLEKRGYEAATHQGGGYEIFMTVPILKAYRFYAYEQSLAGRRFLYERPRY